MQPTNPAEIKYRRLISRLQERGYRLTSHRLALIRMIVNSEEHPSAIQIYENLRERLPTISLATIYKTLAILKEEGELLEIDLHDNSHYDATIDSHPHLVCTNCKRIMDIDLATEVPLAVINQEILEKKGFKVSNAQLVFYGLCDNCQKISKAR